MSVEPEHKCCDCGGTGTWPDVVLAERWWFHENCLREIPIRTPRPELSEMIDDEQISDTSDNDCIIRIPHAEAAARREWLNNGCTLDECRKHHDKAVADAADWSYYIGLLEWTPPREFKVGDVVRWSIDDGPDSDHEFTVRGIFDGALWDGSMHEFAFPASRCTLVKAVDDAG